MNKPQISKERGSSRYESHPPDHGFQVSPDTNHLNAATLIDPKLDISKKASRLGSRGFLIMNDYLESICLFCAETCREGNMSDKVTGRKGATQILHGGRFNN
jgi:hypothetical protein